MNTLRLHVINSHSPYEVRQNPHDVNSYLFKTDANVEYVISLIENNSIVPSGTYEFGINNPKHNKSPLDPKLRNTIFAIVEEFFDVNGDEAMLYLADTGDGKQAFRHRGDRHAVRYSSDLCVIPDKNSLAHPHTGTGTLCWARCAVSQGARYAVRSLCAFLPKDV